MCHLKKHIVLAEEQRWKVSRQKTNLEEVRKREIGKS